MTDTINSILKEPDNDSMGDEDSSEDLQDVRSLPVSGQPELSGRSPEHPVEGAAVRSILPKQSKPRQQNAANLSPAEQRFIHTPYAVIRPEEIEDLKHQHKIQGNTEGILLLDRVSSFSPTLRDAALTLLYSGRYPEAQEEYKTVFNNIELAVAGVSDTFNAFCKIMNTETPEDQKTYNERLALMFFDRFKDFVIWDLTETMMLATYLACEKAVNLGKDEIHMRYIGMNGDVSVPVSLLAVSHYIDGITKYWETLSQGLQKKYFTADNRTQRARNFMARFNNGILIINPRADTISQARINLTTAKNVSKEVMSLSWRVDRTQKGLFFDRGTNHPIREGVFKAGKISPSLNILYANGYIDTKLIQGVLASLSSNYTHTVSGASPFSDPEDPYRKEFCLRDSRKSGTQIVTPDLYKNFGSIMDYTCDSIANDARRNNQSQTTQN